MGRCAGRGDREGARHRLRAPGAAVAALALALFFLPSSLAPAGDGPAVPGGALAHLAGHVTLVEDPADLRGVSSTLAREELRREEGGLATGDGGGGGGGGGVTGGSWLVPPAVAEEARRRGMYR